MLHTPNSFTPVIIAQQDLHAHTFIFQRDHLLLRESDLSLPDASLLEILKIQPHRLHPVGLWEQNYYQTTWVEHNVEAPTGYVFRNMRALFGVMGDDFLGVASRACQLAEWSRTHQFVESAPPRRYSETASAAMYAQTVACMPIHVFRRR